ncbi:MAG: transporter [Ramlibacter sp.]|nr:transporter [Ramlibacter sp.]
MHDDSPPLRLAGIRQRLASSWLVPAACAIALLHFGEDVLRPLTLAGILSLVIAPLVRSMRRWGLGRATATIASVVLVGCCVLAATGVLAFQLAAAANDLPKYRSGIVAKIEQARAVTVRPLEKWRADLGLASLSGSSDGASAPQPPDAAGTRTANDLDPTVPGLLAIASRALAECGIVLVLLVFILLEQDALRDRLLRFTGHPDLTTAVQALAETGDGVSRLFLAQCIVNLCFGSVIGTALWAVGIPHAALFGALAGLMRFVPYVGILAAGAVITAFAAAVAPGWSLVLAIVAALAAVELLVANAIEPRVYGHSSGLAPMAIIVSALFWSAIWGPVGLILSTPLTLCLVVAGRHVPALEPITILFGDSPGLTQGQILYSRARSGDLASIQEDARSFLRRRRFASYCDDILLPGIALAAADYLAGRIQAPQLQAVRGAVLEVVESLTGGKGTRMASRRRPPATLLESSAGAHLRQARLGGRQGPLRPAGSIVLCAGLSTERDKFATELLVRAFLDAGLDARSAPLPHPADSARAPTGLADLISIVFIAYPEESALANWRDACRQLRAELPRALLATVRLPLDTDGEIETAVQSEVDLVLRSFAEAVAFTQEVPAP